MIDESKFDKDLISIYNILTHLNYTDLQNALNNKSLYMKSSFSEKIGEKLDYSQLNLDDFQQEVIENYINLLNYETTAKIFLTYLKAVEHTLKFINDTKILHNIHTPKE